MVYSADRIRTPLIRSDPKGTVAFRPATWDEALDRVLAPFGSPNDMDCGSNAEYFGSKGDQKLDFFQEVGGAWLIQNIQDAWVLWM